MRTVFAALVMAGFAALTAAQPPKDPPPKDPPKEPAPKDAPKDPDPVPIPKDLQPRYGVKPRAKQYPQDAPKSALKSALAAFEAADYPYLVAHILDPKFVDDAVAERAKLFEPGVQAEFAQLRDFQRANPTKFAPEDRVPLDPRGFAKLVYDTSRERAFKLLLRDVQQRLTDDPQAVKEMRRISREGTFADADPAATATHPDVKGRALYFKKVGERWFLENRQTEEPKKEP